MYRVSMWLSQVSAPIIDTSDMDPELARYLNRNYWEQKAVATTTTPSAPIATSTAASSQSNNAKANTTSSVTSGPAAKVQEVRSMWLHEIMFC